MIIANADYDLLISLDENTVTELVVERTDCYTKIVDGIVHQINGDEGGFVFSEKDKELKPEAISEIVLDYFNFEINNRKVLNKLYSNSEKLAEEECVEEKNRINELIVSSLDTITTKLGYSQVEYSLDFKWSDIFKTYGLQIADSFENLMEKMDTYLYVLSELTPVRILFLVNMKSFFTQEEYMIVPLIERYTYF